MSNDPLPLSDVSTGPANDTEYQVVYAAIAASDRGRSFLREYASRIRRPETQSLINTISRLEAATLESAPPQLPPALLRGLVDLAAVIERLRRFLRPAAARQPTIFLPRSASKISPWRFASAMLMRLYATRWRPALAKSVTR